MRTAGDDFWNDTTYILSTLSVRAGLEDKRDVKRTLKALALAVGDSETTAFQLACKRDCLGCFFSLSLCSGRSPPWD